MLEPVALNQTRFNAPGVAPDNRGVVLGKQGALLFASVDRLVGFFRIFCDESSMDELSAQAQDPPGAHAADVARVPGASTRRRRRTSSTAPRASRRSSAGSRFTGSGKHFVKYRDTASPLGYDATALYAEPADFVLYSDTFTQGYQRVKDVEFAQLVFRLSPRRLPGDVGRRPAGSRAAVAGACAGLWRARC